MPKASEPQREYAARALLLAGYALSEPTPSLADRRLAQLLLRECHEACSEAAGVRDAPLFVLEAEGPSGADELRAVEEQLALRVKALFGERDPRRVSNWVGLSFGAIALVVLLALVVAALLPGAESASYTWRSSSAKAGFKREGFLGDHGTADLVFHTEEELNPWVIIDMQKERKISQVILKNRADCCPERGLPMVVEVQGANGYVEIGRTAKIFDTWKLNFSPRTARFIRIRAEALTVIHLREVIVP